MGMQSLGPPCQLACSPCWDDGGVVSKRGAHKGRHFSGVGTGHGDLGRADAVGGAVPHVGPLTHETPGCRVRRGGGGSDQCHRT